MPFDFSIPTPNGPLVFQVEAGTSVYFVGPNGGGKTRLAVKIEAELGERAHRISAHRALTMNPGVPKVSEEIANRGLRYGWADQQSQLVHRNDNRWGRNAAVSLLNDYDFLIQALFAEQANTSLKTHKNVRAGIHQESIETKFEKLNAIWSRVLPHRKLDITGDDICVKVNETDQTYKAQDMSDGERASFYLIGQTLAAAPDSLIIFDEPELHIHRAILSKLWDELEAARPDCGIVVISHELDFVASREGEKYVIQDYTPDRGWTVERVPEDTGFSEYVVGLILGSRKPILFVEGEQTSLDQAIYRACYQGWTVIPQGSCEGVIHAVVTMRAHASLTQIKCAGVVDADDYNSSEITFLAQKGIGVLPVAEIENLFLIPNVVEAIAYGEGYEGDQLKAKVDEVLSDLFDHANDLNNRRSSVLRYCRRRIDRALKKIDLSEAKDVAALASEYQTRTQQLDVHQLANQIDSAITQAIENKDAQQLLKWYDNKGILHIAAKAKGTTKANFEQWISRVLQNQKAPLVTGAIKALLPGVRPI